MTVPGLKIIPDDLTGEAVIALLQLHLDDMHRFSPADSVHAMPAEQLRAAQVSFFSAWDAGDLAGCGAFRMIGPGHAELKSMRVAPSYRRQGVGEAILLHLLAAVRAAGALRVSLETGRTEPFRPAQMLYRKHGFTECPPFGSYVSDDFSQCMTKVL